MSPYSSGRVPSPRDAAHAAPVLVCDDCGCDELYAVSRYLEGRLVHLQMCRRCQPANPLVRAFDAVTDELFAE